MGRWDVSGYPEIKVFLRSRYPIFVDVRSSSGDFKYFGRLIKMT